MTTVLSLYDPLDRLTDNERAVLEITRAFAEIEDDDPRLAFVVTYARLHPAIDRLVKLHGAKQTNGATPRLFKTATSALHRAGVLTDDFYEFCRLFARTRNYICHFPTDRLTLLRDRTCYANLQRMHELARGISYWPCAIDPEADLRRSVLSLCVIGCLAIELRYEGLPAGFEVVERFQAEEALHHG